MGDRKIISYNIIRNTYAKLFCLINRVSFVNNTGYYIPSEGPLLIISNHVGTYDPIEITAKIKRHIHWVTGAYLFKMKFVGFLMRHVLDAIPKQQGRSDIATVSCMQKHIKQGRVVGIFPEGTRTWDGDTLQVNYTAIAKMIRILKAPVVIMSIEGGFAREPRWVVSRRRGPVIINAKHIIKADDIARLSTDEIANILEENFVFSNDEWKQNVNYTYKSKCRAEGVQRLLYMCPECGKTGTITAKGDTIICSSCGMQAKLTEKDDIKSESVKFKRLSEWHKWERDSVYSIKSFPAEPGCLLQKADSLESESFCTLSKNIMVSMTDCTIHISYENGCLDFRMQDISSFILNTKQTMEFIADGIIYRIRVMPSSSSLKYLEYYEACKKENDNV